MEKNESKRKNGRIVSVIFAIFSFIMLFVSSSWGLKIVDQIFWSIFLLIPFLVIFINRSSIIRKNLLFVIFFGIILLTLLYDKHVDNLNGFWILGCVSYLTSCILAKVFPRDVSSYASHIDYPDSSHSSTCEQCGRKYDPYYKWARPPFCSSMCRANYNGTH
jgi:hypothetical protein